MSDPVENVEIEDVLSSIRRLVSSDGREERPTRSTIRRAEEPGEEGGHADSTEEQGGNKLVLTPALRVDDSEESKLQTREPDPRPETETHDHDTTGDTADETPEWLVLDDDDPRTEAYGGEEDDDNGWDDVEDAEFVDVTDKDAAKDKAKLPEFLRHSDAHHADPAEPATTERAAEGQADDAAETDHEEARTEDTLSESEELLSRVDNFSAAVDEAGEFYDPEPGSDDENAAEDASVTLPWAEMEAAEADANPKQQTADPADAETGLDDDWPGQQPDAAAKGASGSPDWLDDDAVIDEDMLRDMVAEIVRQELQGALGERITRNVRKLVRREINRALMSQGID